MLSKSQEKRIEVQKEVAKPTPESAKMTHRYVCDACTNVAAVSSDPFKNVSITCQACGKTQQCKKENWIKL